MNTQGFFPIQETVRRVVTGTTENGRSTVATDHRVPVSLNLSNAAIAELWQTARVPVGDQEFFEDTTVVRQLPPHGGLKVRMCYLPPDREWQSGRHPGDGMYADMDMGTDPYHRTDTVDVVCVLSGALRLCLDEAEVDLQPGDVVVQEGTGHAWSNPGHTMCVILAIMVDAHAG